MPETPAISVVIPAHNEEGNVRLLFEELKPVLDGLARPWEVIFVDDGSGDGTAARLRELHEADARVRVLRFARNRGQSAAVDAGIRGARGEVVVTMDADLQNDTADIPALVAALEGCDLVNGWRRDRRDPFLRRLSTGVANGVRRCVLRDGIQDSGTAMRALRRACMERVKLYQGMHRFLPALFQIEGFRVREVPIRHRPRRAGRSHYGIWNRVFRAWVDLWAVRWMRRRRLGYEIIERYER